MIRAAQSADHPGIRWVLEAAFPTPEEADAVERLRADGAMALELVHEEAGMILGHVAFSRMAEPEGTLGLAPLAVLPAAEGRGIGSGLVRAGLDRVRAGDSAAVFVLGDPAYYTRFGFSVEAATGFSSAFPPEHMMALILHDLPPAARRICYADALEGG